MADEFPTVDFTRSPQDTTLPQGDFRRKHLPEPPEGQFTIDLNEPKANAEKTWNTEYQRLMKLGYSTDVLDQLFTPSGSRPRLDQFDGYAQADTIGPTRMIGTQEGLKLGKHLMQTGLHLPEISRENLVNAMTKLNPPSMLAEAHDWLSNTRRVLANTAAGAVTSGSVYVGLGTALLDIIDRFDKAGLTYGEINGIPIGIPGKIHALTFPGPNRITPEERHDLENRIMPSIVLHTKEGDKKFSTSTAAGLWILREKTWGIAENMWIGPSGELVGGVLTAGSKLIGNESLQEIGEAIRLGSQDITQRGAERQTQAFGQVPPLVSALGESSVSVGSGISWIDIVTRRFNLEDEFEEYLGNASNLEIAGLALAGGAADTIVTPSFWVGPALGKLPGGLSKVARFLPRMGARGLAETEIATKVARKTVRIDDAITAVEEATRYHADVDNRYMNAMRANIRATGKPSVPADLYQEWWSSRRIMNNNKQWLDNFKDPTEDEILMRVPRRSPKLLPAPEDTPKISDDFEVVREMARDRETVITNGPADNLDHVYRNEGHLQQRKVLGPDDAEVAGDGLELLIKTGGLAVDDIATAPLAPEYYVSPASGTIPMLDWSNVPQLKSRAKIEQNALKILTGETTGYNADEYLQASTLRMLVQEEDIVRRNLGTARAVKNKERMKLYQDALDRVQAQIASVKKNPVKSQSYENVWLPQGNETIMSTPERFNRWIREAGDRVVRGLYPGSLQLATWDSKAGQAFANLREPQRFYEAVDPAGWDIMRSATLRRTQSHHAWNEMMVRVLEPTGIIKRRSGKFNPKKHWHPYDVSPKASEPLFDLLDTVKGTDEFNMLWEEATPKMRTAHNRIREVMDAAADLQGLPATERYLEGYIRHSFDKSTMKYGQRDLSLVGLSQDAEIFASHLMDRRGNKGYSKDLVAALEVYGRMMHRKTIMEPALETLLQRANQYPNMAHRLYAHSFVRQLKGQPGLLGRALDKWIGTPINEAGGIPIRPAGAVGEKLFPELPKTIKWQPSAVDRQIMGFTSLGYMGMLGGNPAYPFMQIVTAVPTTAGRFGWLRTMKGVFGMATQEGQTLAKVAGVYQPFIDVLESPAFQTLSKFIFEKVPAISPFGVMSNARAEMSIRGLTHAVARDAYLTKFGFATWEEAVQAGWGRRIQYEALRASEEVNHMFGAMGRHPAMTETIGQGFSVAATQFLSFTWKQTDELLSQTLRNPGKLLEYLGVSGWLAQVAARDLGIDATSYVGLGYLPAKIEDVTSPALDALGSLRELEMALQDRDPQRTKWAADNVLRNLTSMVPGMAGFEKSAKSVKKLMTGEQRTANGDLLREMDFKGTQGLKALAPERPSGQPGIGPEIIPTVFMQRNMKEALWRQHQKAQMAEHDRIYFNTQTAVEDYIHAVDTEDPEAEQKLLANLQDKYNIRLSGAGPIERATQARSLAWDMRFIHPKFGGDRNKFDLYMENLKRFGIGMEDLIPAAEESEQ